MVFSKEALKKLEEIHCLSSIVNSNDHRKKLIELVKKHAEEIEQLYKKDDPHADIEAGDLAILCFELILESRKNPDRILEKCFERYEKKLSQLAEEKSGF